MPGGNIMLDDCAKALDFWTVGIEYLHLVQAVSNETHNQGNAHVVISETPLTESEYAEQTKWSDHNLVMPLLFNFYHGLEVILKGFRLASGLGGRHSHKLSDLLTEFKTQYPEDDLIPLLEKYILQTNLPPILSEFCTTSGITIDDYYQTLKYPESTQGVQYEHHPLKYRAEEGAMFFAELRDDIEKIRRKTVSLSGSVCS
jgi:hypothetical protein